MGHIDSDIDVSVKNISVLVEESVSIPTNLECIVRAKVEPILNNKSKTDFIFHPNKKLSLLREITCAFQLVSIPKDGYIYIRLINLDNKQKWLPGGLKLGHLEPVLENVFARQTNIEKRSTLSFEDIVKMHVNGLNKEESEILSTVLEEFKDIFSYSKMDLGVYSDIKHTINTSTNHPIAIPPRRIPMAVEDEVERHIDELLENNIIRESDSPWNAPIVVVPKGDGSIRMCIDYRSLNKITDRPVFAFPDPVYLFDQLAGCKYFSTIDLSQGYYQVKMSEQDIAKTAFTTKSGHYEFLRMPFGLVGAATTFQKVMNHIMRGLNWSSCLIYLDDVCIFGKDLCEHENRLRQVFSAIKKSGIKLSPNKCKFLKRQVKYLGHVISEKGLQTDPEKINKIADLPLPKFEHELVSFIGFCGYYRRFINKFSELTSPLEKICSKKTKNIEIIWTSEAKAAFEKLKILLTSTPILSFPIKHGLFILDTDASDTGTGAVLSQIQDKEERVIAFASHKLSKTERKYCTTRKELLAVHKYVLQFKNYLFGKKFIIRTDHKALTWLKEWKEPNTSQYSHWRQDLSDFDFDITYRPGTEHSNADYLSRLQCQQCQLNHKNPKLKRNYRTYSLDEIKIRRINVQQKYLYQQATDKNIMNILSLMKNGKLHECLPNELKDSPEQCYRLWKNRFNFRIRGDQLFFLSTDNKYLYVVPENKRHELIIHTHRSLGHLGVDKTFSFLKDRFFWPDMRIDIKMCLRRCKNCAENKKTDFGVTQLKPTLSQFPFQKIDMDVAGPLPRSTDGYRYLLVIIDSFSKFCVLVPLKEISSATISKAIFEKWISVFGCPFQIHSDNATYFSSDFMKQICQSFNIHQTFSSPYHPQGNGLAERTIQTVKNMLRTLLYQKAKHLWPNIVSEVEMALRCSENATTGFTPYETIFGNKMHINMFPDWHDEQPSDKQYDPLNAFDNKLKNIHQAVRENIKMKAFKNCRQNKIRKELRIGDKVMIENLGVMRKCFDAKYVGPFTIIKIIDGISFVVVNKEGKKFRRHRDQIKLIATSVESLISESLISNKKEIVENKRWPQRSRQQIVRYGLN